MALKPYNELRNFDVKPYIKERDGAAYLPWAVCMDLLHQNGAERVYFEPLTNDKGSSLFMSDKTFADKDGYTNNCYEIAVRVYIDDVSFEVREPLMNGKNPVKDNSLTQQRVGNAQKRAFVKGVAIRTGLGFSLWSDDVSDIDDTSDDLSKHSLKAIRERVLEKVTELMKRGISEDDIAANNNMSVEEMKGLFSYFTSINRFERSLNDLLSK